MNKTMYLINNTDVNWDVFYNNIFKWTISSKNLKKSNFSILALNLINKKYY